MDFFQAQESARSRSRLLVALFLAAVVGIIVTVYLVVHLALAATGDVAPGFDPYLFATISALTTLLVAGGSTYRTLQLRSGGARVAEMLGGRRVSSDTTDPAERRLVNVVEEMAIASGMPVPAIFVLDHEPGINAFAAGYTIHDAAVAVTRGTLERLNRDELQGVVAHEFSHILNGDMRLNIRLIGLLFGILLLSVVGRGLLRTGTYSGRSRRGSGGQVALVGLALVLVGSVGVVFGRLIKAAVSRQREFLADAAAVQFTRNPSGIANALKKIGGAAALGGSAVRNHHAEELSHLFFAEGLRRAFSGGLLSTHPPLDERIRRIEPHWDGKYIPVEAGDATAAAPPATPGRPEARPGPAAPASRAWGAPEWAAVARLEQGAAPGRAPGAGPERGPAPGGPASPGPLAVAPAAILESFGTPTPAHVALAARLLADLPEPVREAAHDPVDAQALVAALLLSEDDAALAAQRAAILDRAGDALLARVDRLARDVATLPAGARLPLIDLALPALRQLPPERAAVFRELVRVLAAADGRATLFEFALIQILERQLGGGAKGPRAAEPARRVHSLAPLREAVERVLSAVARAGAADVEAMKTAFAAATNRLPAGAGPWRLLDASQIGGVDQLTAALEELRRGDPAVRRRFLSACAYCIAHDGRVSPSEAELFRAIAEALDVPTPPILPG